MAETEHAECNPFRPCSPGCGALPKRRASSYSSMVLGQRDVTALADRSPTTRAAREIADGDFAVKPVRLFSLEWCGGTYEMTFVDTQHEDPNVAAILRDVSDILVGYALVGPDDDPEDTVEGIALCAGCGSFSQLSVPLKNALGTHKCECGEQMLLGSWRPLGAAKR